MRRMTLTWIAMLTLLSGTLAAQQMLVRLTLRSGEVIVGELLDLSGAGFAMRLNDGMRQVHEDGVTLVDFGGGGSAATGAEVDRLRTSRHLLVLRSGAMVGGRLMAISGGSRMAVVFETEAGRREYALTDVSRIVLGMPSSVPMAPDFVPAPPTPVTNAPAAVAPVAPVAPVTPAAPAPAVPAPAAPRPIGIDDIEGEWTLTGTALVNGRAQNAAATLRLARIEAKQLERRVSSFLRASCTTADQRPPLVVYGALRFAVGAVFQTVIACLKGDTLVGAFNNETADSPPKGTFMLDLQNKQGSWKTSDMTGATFHQWSIERKPR